MSLSIPVTTKEGDAIALELNDDTHNPFEFVATVIFAEIGDDWDTWLGYVGDGTHHVEDQHAQLALAACNELRNTPAMALLMLAYGYSEIAMNGDAKRELNNAIATVFNERIANISGNFFKHIPNAKQVYIAASNIASGVR